MKICIIGAGVVGTYLAKQLSEEGYQVAVVDRNKSKIEELENSIDVIAHSCNALEEECLSLFKDYDLYIVVTDKDEVNLAIALFLRTVFGKNKIIIRQEKELSENFQKSIEGFLNVEIIDALNEIYKNIELIIKYPFISDFYEIDEGNFILIGFKINKENPLKNKQISDLKEYREKIPFTIVLIERDENIIIPTGSRNILEDDFVYILLEKKNLDSFIDMFNIPNKPVKNVYFLGVSDIGFGLVKGLSNIKGLNIKVFEPDIEKCEEIAEKFTNVMVINGKFTDEELLRKENIESADIVISASYKEESILACILAKKLGAKKVLALIEQPEYEEIAHSLDIDIPIVSRKLIARKVYRKIKHRGFIDLFQLKENIRIYEIYVDEKLAEKTVKDISTGNFIILGIKRDNEMYIAQGNTILKEGDVLIVLEKEEDE